MNAKEYIYIAFWKKKHIYIYVKTQKLTLSLFFVSIFGNKFQKITRPQKKLQTVLSNNSRYWAFRAGGTSFGLAFHTWFHRGCFRGIFHRFIKIIHHVGEEIAAFPDRPSSLAIRACYHLKVAAPLAHTKRPKLTIQKSDKTYYSILCAVVTEVGT